MEPAIQKWMRVQSGPGLSSSCLQVLVGGHPYSSSDREGVGSGEHQEFARARRIQLQARVVRSRAAAVRAQRQPKAQPLPRLSPKESDVLALLSRGMTTKDLAVQLGISVNTANYHLSNIYRKLGAHSRVEAANAYFMRGRPN